MSEAKSDSIQEPSSEPCGRFVTITCRINPTACPARHDSKLPYATKMQRAARQGRLAATQSAAAPPSRQNARQPCDRNRFGSEQGHLKAHAPRQARTGTAYRTPDMHGVPQRPPWADVKACGQGSEKNRPTESPFECSGQQRLGEGSPPHSSPALPPDAQGREQGREGSIACQTQDASTASTRSKAGPQPSSAPEPRNTASHKHN